MKGMALELQLGTRSPKAKLKQLPSHIPEPCASTTCCMMAVFRQAAPGTLASVESLWIASGQRHSGKHIETQAEQDHGMSGDLGAGTAAATQQVL